MVFSINRLALLRQPVFIFSTSLLVSKVRLFILLKISKQKQKDNRIAIDYTVFLTKIS